MKKRCDVCNGKRKIVGAGGMHRDCSECGGSGVVDVEMVKPKLRRSSGKYIEKNEVE